MSDAMRIGLLGAPGSGKLTFLSALSLAGPHLPEDDRWTVDPDSDNTAGFMNSATRILMEEKRFPQRGSVESIRDVLGFSFRREGEQHSAFRVEVVNLPGERFADDRADLVETAKNLASCDGFILLFDPIKEQWGHDNHRFLYALRNRIVAQRRDGGFTKPLAVACVKYDDPQVFLPALAEGWGTEQDTKPRFPWVTDAKRFFEWACGHFGDGSGERVLEEVGGKFDPARTAFFVTRPSASGPAAAGSTCTTSSTRKATGSSATSGP